MCIAHLIKEAAFELRKHRADSQAEAIPTQPKRKTQKPPRSLPRSRAYKSSEKALIAVIQEAWITGVSTRRVDDLV